MGRGVSFSGARTVVAGGFNHYPVTARLSIASSGRRR
jgi:hypothetical protein